MNKLCENTKPEVKIRRELTLHSLEDWILSGCLSAASQRFGRGTAERRRDDTGDIVLHSDAKRADKLCDKVESVWRHRRLRDVGTVLERDRSALDERLAQLTKYLLVPVLTEPHHLKL